MASKRKLKRKVKRALITVMVVSILCLAGVITYSVINRSGDKEHTADETYTEIIKQNENTVTNEYHNLSENEAKQMLESLYVGDTTEYIMKDYVVDLNGEYYVFHYGEEVFFVKPEDGTTVRYMSEDGSYETLEASSGLQDLKTPEASNELRDLKSSDNVYVVQDQAAGIIDSMTPEIFVESFINALYNNPNECVKYIDLSYTETQPVGNDRAQRGQEDAAYNAYVFNISTLNRMYKEHCAAVKNRSINEFFYTVDIEANSEKDEYGVDWYACKYDRQLHIDTDNDNASFYGDGTHVYMKIALRKYPYGWRVVVFEL